MMLPLSNPRNKQLPRELSKSCLKMVAAVLQLAIEKRVATSVTEDDCNLLEKYGRVVVQDSTVIRLPEWLFGEFSGVSNAHSCVCNARIQALYDLKARSLVSFCCYDKRKLLNYHQKMRNVALA